jgi:hypothetical protein
MPRAKHEQAMSRELQRAIWRAERGVAKKVASYEHLVRAAMLVRERVAPADLPKRGQMAVAVLCRALERLGR